MSLLCIYTCLALSTLWPTTETQSYVALYNVLTSWLPISVLMLWHALENALKEKKSNWNCQQNADWSASVSKPLKMATCKRITLSVCLCICVFIPVRMSNGGRGLRVKMGKRGKKGPKKNLQLNWPFKVQCWPYCRFCRVEEWTRVWVRNISLTTALEDMWNVCWMSQSVFLASTCIHDSVRSPTHGHCLSVLFRYRMLFYPFMRALSHGLVGEESRGGMYITNCIGADETLLWSWKG